jgi:hypothetical protein
MYVVYRGNNYIVMANSEKISGSLKTSRAAAKAKKNVKESQTKSSNSYNSFKKFEGRQYTGMQIGRSHHWDYDPGDWKETKITPDLWEINYAVTKRRKGQAPEGSGVPVGTEYHWYILSHQNVKKLNANDYSTEMHGLKFKLAHKRADKDKWSLSGTTQRKHLIAFLKEMIEQLEKEPVPLEFEYGGKKYKGEGVPVPETCDEDVCYQLDVELNDQALGIIRCAKSGWKMDGVEQELVEAIGDEIFAYYE